MGKAEYLHVELRCSDPRWLQPLQPLSCEHCQNPNSKPGAPLHSKGKQEETGASFSTSFYPVLRFRLSLLFIFVPFWVDHVLLVKRHALVSVVVFFVGILVFSPFSSQFEAVTPLTFALFGCAPLQRTSIEKKPQTTKPNKLKPLANDAVGWAHEGRT